MKRLLQLSQVSAVFGLMGCGLIRPSFEGGSAADRSKESWLLAESTDARSVFEGAKKEAGLPYSDLDHDPKGDLGEFLEIGMPSLLTTTSR